MKNKPESEHDPEDELDFSSFLTPEESDESKSDEDAEAIFEDVELWDDIEPKSPEGPAGVSAETGSGGDIWPGMPEGSSGGISDAGTEGDIWPKTPEEPVDVGADVEPEGEIWPKTPEEPVEMVADADSEGEIWPKTPEGLVGVTADAGTEGEIWPKTPEAPLGFTGDAGPESEIWPKTPETSKKPESVIAQGVKPVTKPSPGVTTKTTTSKWPFAVMAASLLVAAGTVGWTILHPPSTPTETSGNQQPGTPNPVVVVQPEGANRPVSFEDEFEAISEPANKAKKLLEWIEQASNDPQRKSEALEKAKTAVEWARKSDDMATRRQAASVLGDIQESMGQRKEARETYSEELAQAKVKKDKESEAVFEASIEILDSTEATASPDGEPKNKGAGPQGSRRSRPLIEILVALQPGLPALPPRIQQKIDRARPRATDFPSPPTLFALALAYQEAGNHYQGLKNNEAAARYFKDALDQCAASLASLSGSSNRSLPKMMSDEVKKIGAGLDATVTAIATALRESETKVGTLTADNATLQMDKTKLVDANATLQMDKMKLADENMTLKMDKTKLAGDYAALKTKYDGLTAPGAPGAPGAPTPSTRMTRGEERWAIFARKLAGLAGVNPEGLPGQDDRWKGPDNADATTEGWMKSLESGLDDRIKRNERLAYGEKQWAAFAQGLAKAVGFAGTLPAEDVRWKQHPETDAETTGWMDGLGQIIREQGDATNRHGYGEQKWADFAETVAKKVDYKPALPKSRWAKTPDTATERWANELASLIPSKNPPRLPTDQAFKEFNAGYEDYFHCRYPQAVARFDAAIGHSPDGDARFSYFRGLARLADHQTGGASTLEDAMQDLRQGLQLEGREFPSPRQVSNVLTRIQNGLREWLEVFRMTGSPAPGPPPLPYPCTSENAAVITAASANFAHGIPSGCACLGRSN